MRHIFVALNLSDEIKERLIKLQKKIAQYLPNFRWIKPVNLHLTLVFLGRVDPKKIVKLIEIIKKTVENVEPFTIDFARVGVFPESRRAKIIWVGVEESSILGALNQTFYRKLKKNNFVLDERDFTPHVTIGRTKEKVNKEAVNYVLSKYPNSKFGQLKVESIDIMESELKRSGAEYQIIEQIKLKNGG